MDKDIVKEAIEELTNSSYNAMDSKYVENNIKVVPLNIALRWINKLDVKAPKNELLPLDEKEVESTLIWAHGEHYDGVMPHDSRRIKEIYTPAIMNRFGKLDTRFSEDKILELLYSTPYRVEMGNQLENYAKAICSKFGSSGKRPLNKEDVAYILVTEYQLGTKDSEAIADLICKEFSNADVKISEERIEEIIMDSNLSTMCVFEAYARDVRDLAKALKAELDGK